MKTKILIHFFQLFLLIGNIVNAIQIRRSITKSQDPKQQNSQCYCGESNPLGTRIFGGKVTKPDDFPWQALVMYQNKQSCGGSVISDRYILTAGHCVNNFQISSMTVVLGVYDRLQMNLGTEVYYKVIKGTLHPNFASHDIHDLRDIGLLKVDKQIQFNQHIKPVCLPNKGTIFDGKVATITGWGRRSFEGYPSRVLLSANVRVLSDEQCSKSNLGAHVAEDRDSMFCAYERNKDACQGDSGGPLVYRSPKGVMYLIGIISWGEKCGVIDYPGVYTRVSTFHDWIRQNTEDSNYCNPKQ